MLRLHMTNTNPTSVIIQQAIAMENYFTTTDNKSLKMKKTHSLNLRILISFNTEFFNTNLSLRVEKSTVHLLYPPPHVTYFFLIIFTSC